MTECLNNGVSGHQLVTIHNAEALDSACWRAPTYRKEIRNMRNQTTLDLEKRVTKQIEDHSTQGTLQITPQATDEPAVTLNLGSHWGMVYTHLTPTEARKVAYRLVQTASKIEAAEPQPETDPQFEEVEAND